MMPSKPPVGIDIPRIPSPPLNWVFYKSSRRNSRCADCYGNVTPVVSGREPSCESMRTSKESEPGSDDPLRGSRSRSGSAASFASTSTSLSALSISTTTSASESAKGAQCCRRPSIGNQGRRCLAHSHSSSVDSIATDEDEYKHFQDLTQALAAATKRRNLANRMFVLNPRLRAMARSGSGSGSGSSVPGTGSGNLVGSDGASGPHRPRGGSGSFGLSPISDAGVRVGGTITSDSVNGNICGISKPGKSGFPPEASTRDGTPEMPDAQGHKRSQSLLPSPTGQGPTSVVVQALESVVGLQISQSPTESEGPFVNSAPTAGEAGCLVGTGTDSPSSEGTITNLSSAPGTPTARLHGKRDEDPSSVRALCASPEPIKDADPAMTDPEREQWHQLYLDLVKATDEEVSAYAMLRESVSAQRVAAECEIARVEAAETARVGQKANLATARMLEDLRTAAEALHDNERGVEAMLARAQKRKADLPAETVLWSMLVSGVRGRA